MNTTKMSLCNIQGKLSRTEMKNIMAGSGSSCSSSCPQNGTCKTCTETWCKGLCYCSNGLGSCS